MRLYGLTSIPANPIQTVTRTLAIPPGFPDHEIVPSPFHPPALVSPCIARAHVAIVYPDRTLGCREKLVQATATGERGTPATKVAILYHHVGLHAHPHRYPRIRRFRRPLLSTLSNLHLSLSRTRRGATPCTITTITTIRSTVAASFTGTNLFRTSPRSTRFPRAAQQPTRHALAHGLSYTKHGRLVYSAFGAFLQSVGSRLLRRHHTPHGPQRLCHGSTRTLETRLAILWERRRPLVPVLFDSGTDSTGRYFHARIRATRLLPRRAGPYAETATSIRDRDRLGVRPHQPIFRLG